jgi:Fe-S cluster biogenesis protein NfuA
LQSRIEAALENFVRPELRAEGGDVELIGVDQDRIVQIRLLGSCQSCGGGAIVLTNEIEAKLKAVIPEIRFLEPIP